MAYLTSHLVYGLQHMDCLPLCRAAFPRLFLWFTVLFFVLLHVVDGAQACDPQSFTVELQPSLAQVAFLEILAPPGFCCMNATYVEPVEGWPPQYQRQADLFASCTN